MQMKHRNPKDWCVSKWISIYFSLFFFFHFEYLFPEKYLPEGDCMYKGKSILSYAAFNES